MTHPLAIRGRRLGLVLVVAAAATLSSGLAHAQKTLNWGTGADVDTMWTCTSPERSLPG